MEHKHFEKFINSADSRPKKVIRIIGMVFVGLIFAICFAIVFGFVVKWLWNWLLPDIFGLKEITYWQAFGIVILAKLLFGAFGSHHSDKWHEPPRPTCDWHHGPFRSFDCKPWDNKSDLRKDYKRFWEEEGKGAFEDYMNRDDKESGEEN